MVYNARLKPLTCAFPTRQQSPETTNLQWYSSTISAFTALPALAAANLDIVFPWSVLGDHPTVFYECSVVRKVDIIVHVVRLPLCPVPSVD